MTECYCGTDHVCLPNAVCWLADFNGLLTLMACWNEKKRLADFDGIAECYLFTECYCGTDHVCSPNAIVERTMSVHRMLLVGFLIADWE